MVLLPALLLLAASGAHGNISNVPDPLVRQAACDCAGFCSGHCSLPTPAGAPETLTLYRLTPRNITDLVNKDTGDAEGDAFFTLDEYDLPMRCSQGAGQRNTSLAPRRRNPAITGPPAGCTLPVRQAGRMSSQ